MGRGKGVESKSYKVIRKILAQCPHCQSFNTWSKGGSGYKGRKRYECLDCSKAKGKGVSFYLSEDAIEIKR